MIEQKIVVDIEHNCDIIELGKQGEHKARKIVFDLSKLIETYGAGTATVVLKRTEFDSPYAVLVETTEQNTVEWIVTSTDTEKAGCGLCEVRFYVGETLAKSTVYKTNVNRSIYSVLQDVKQPMQDLIDKLSETANILLNKFKDIDIFVGRAEKASEDSEKYKDESKQYRDMSETSKNASELFANESKQKSIDSSASAAISKKYAELAEAYTNHPPIISDHSTWLVWNGTQYVDTGLPTKGEIDIQVIGAFVEEYLRKNPFVETDPTVPQWAKQQNKPNYDVSEITNAVDIDTLEDVEATINQNINRVEEIADSAYDLADEANIIAKGKTKARVFSDFQAMEQWVAQYKSELQVGDNFYIIAKDVPDYWWDGTRVQELETQKVDLTNYYNKTQIDAMMSEAGKVKSVNGKTGDVTLNAEDVGALSEDTPIPEEYDDTEVKQDIEDLQNEDVELRKKIGEIEMAKFPNVTIFGQPTIQMGQISNFSRTNYCQFPFVVNFQSQAFQIDCEITTGDEVTQQHNILDSEFGLAFAVRNSRFVIAISTNGTNWNIGEGIGTHVILSNTTYRIKMAWDKINFVLSYSQDGGQSYVVDVTKPLTEQPFPKQMYIGITSDKSTFFNGSINLNHCSLTIANKIVWQGMDDVGLATRMAIDMSNIDESGVARLKELAEVSQLSESVTEIKEDLSVLHKDVFVDEIDLGTLLPNLYLGAYDGQLKNNNSYPYQFAYADYIDATAPMYLSIADGYGYRFYYYDANKNFVGCDTIPTYESRIRLPDEAAFIRVNIRTKDSTVIDYSGCANALHIYRSQILRSKEILDETTTVDNLFYLTAQSETRYGVTISVDEYGYVHFNGTPSLSFYVPLMGADTTSEQNLPAGTYTAKRTTISGTYDGNVSPTLRIREPNTSSYISWSGTQTFESTQIIVIRVPSGSTYNDLTYSFMIERGEIEHKYIKHGISAIDKLARTSIEDLNPRVVALETSNKKPYEGGNIFFTVDCPRPIPFNDEIFVQTDEVVECVMRLPDSYTQNGIPTRMILACHGASGYIRKSSNTWYNSNWTVFMDELVSAGYGVFDCNVVSGTDTEKIGYCLGSPLAVQTARKAYDYVVQNYNVYPEIFVHGTSMGGVLATNFAHAYPQLVLAESSFAGRDFLRYLTSIQTDDAAEIYGYSSYDALVADKFSHCEGISPSLGLVCYNTDGTMQIPPEREKDYSAWIDYVNRPANLSRNEDAGIWCGRFPVPYKAWNSWADAENHTKLQEVLKEAYNRGSSVPYCVINYESGTHTQLSYGQINNMIPQLIAWYKRWE